MAGRCVAGDKTSHAAMRNMMACTVSGQGAGVAAAVSVQTGKSTHSNTSNRVPQRFQFKYSILSNELSLIFKLLENKLKIVHTNYKIR